MFLPGLRKSIFDVVKLAVLSNPLDLANRAITQLSRGLRIERIGYQGLYTDGTSVQHIVVGFVEYSHVEGVCFSSLMLEGYACEPLGSYPNAL